MHEPAATTFTYDATAACLARLAIFAMVALLQPVAACIEPQDCLACSMRPDRSIAFWAAPVEACCLGFGLALRLPPAAVVEILPGHRSEHVE
jgi:hypothetical protein